MRHDHEQRDYHYGVSDAISNIDAGSYANTDAGANCNADADTDSISDTATGTIARADVNVLFLVVDLLQAVAVNAESRICSNGVCMDGGKLADAIQ
jgi:hypothetical protein